jgi:hypothetical protein
MTYDDEWIMARHGYHTPPQTRADFVARPREVA